MAKKSFLDKTGLSRFIENVRTLLSDYSKKSDVVVTIERNGTTFVAKNAAGQTLFTFNQQDSNTITRVKGNAESSYRSGDVNLTMANLCDFGLNPTGGVANDTIGFWQNKGSGYCFINATNQINGQPATYGFLINYTLQTEVHQEFWVSPNGAHYRRGTTGPIGSTTAMPTWTPCDTNTTYSAGLGLQLSGTQFLTHVPRVAKDANYLPGLNRWSLEEFQQGTAYNLPSNGWYHIYTAQGSDGNYATQLALGLTVDAAYYRSYRGGTWGAWRSIIDTNTYTAVKGNAESAYRTGNVNITAANLGFQWSGQSSQPTWLWGGNAQNDYKVWNPSNFSVNYANSAGSSTNATRATSAATADLANNIKFPTKDTFTPRTGYIIIPRTARLITIEVPDINNVYHTFTIPSMTSIIDSNTIRDYVSGYYYNAKYNASVGIRISKSDANNYMIQTLKGWCSCCANNTTPQTGANALKDGGVGVSSYLV